MAETDKDIYDRIDDRADKITSLEFKARAWGVMKKVTSLMALGVLVAGVAVSTFPFIAGVLGALALGGASVACSFQERSTWQHAADLEERYDMENIMDEVYRERGRGQAPQQTYSHNVETSQFQNQTTQFSPTQGEQMTDNNYTQMQAGTVNDSNQSRGDGKSWGGATRESQAQTQNYR